MYGAQLLPPPSFPPSQSLPTNTRIVQYAAGAPSFRGRSGFVYAMPFEHLNLRG